MVKQKHDGGQELIWECGQQPPGISSYISPNPANGTFTLSISGTSEAQILITDVAGRVVETAKATSGATIQLSDVTGVNLLTA